MIKVLNVISDTNIGGAGTVLLSVLRHIDRSRFDMVIALPGGSRLTEKINALGFRTVAAYCQPDKSYEGAAVSEYRSIIKREKPDIVHTHASLSARIAAFREHIPVRIYTRHSVFDATHMQTAFPYKQISGFANNYLSTRVIAVSEAAKENLIETGVSAKKITVIVNGSEPMREVSDTEKNALREKLGIGKNDFVSVMPARLEKVKGQKYFIGAAAKLVTDHPQSKYLILGGGSQEFTLRELAADLGLNGSVIFCGFADDVAPYLAISDVIVNCSFGTEASSMALEEGMSLSKPAIVSDFGGNIYMVKNNENGLVVAKKDADALALALSECMSDLQFCREMGAHAHERFEKEFTAERMTQQLEALYEEEYKLRSGK